MRPLIGVLVGIALVASAILYVLDDAAAWVQAAQTVDSGVHQLGIPAKNERPGGIYLENDSYYWLSYAKRIARGETLRVRYTFADNPPYGRPVHWSQSMSWLLVIFGKVRQCISGEGWAVALERASPWINPLLLIVTVCGIGGALFRRVGPVPAGLFAIYLVTLGDVGWEFQPLRPDHQSLQALFGIFMLAGLVFGGAGWIRIGSERRNSPIAQSDIKPLEIPDPARARRWFLISGASAAVSLWISAVVATMLLAMLFGAGLVLAVCAPVLPPDGDLKIKPELWRWWGWTAGAGSFLFYLLEYFPHHLSVRLEVNGPLYSLTAVAIGEAVCQFLRARYAERNRAVAPLLKGVLCTMLILVLPVAVFLGPPAWYALRDPEMLRLHNFIQEFYSFPRFAGSKFGTIFVQNFGILPLFLILAIGLAAFSNLRLQEWAVMWLSFAVAVGVMGLAYFQVRWMGLFAAMNAWLAVVTGVCGWRLLRERLSGGFRLLAGIVIIAGLLVQPVLFGYRRNNEVRDIIDQHSLPKELANQVLNKRLALAFRAAEGPGARVMAELDLAPALHYFADAAAVSSFYWENVDGLHAATRFFADSEGDTARQVAVERGLTHVIVEEGNRLQNYFYFIATGKIDQEAAGKLFAARLVGSEFELPDWLQTTPELQQIGYQVYSYGGMRLEERWRIYRIEIR